MSPDPYRVAIDLGAGSGRAFIGRVTRDRLDLQEVHRFHYAPRRAAGHLRWDTVRLFDGLRAGLASARAAAAARGGRLDSVGVDSWAVDYGLIDAGGRLLEEPICYRDERTRGVMEQVFARVPRAEIFSRTGIQFLPLNTLYQLVAHAREGLPPRAARLLLIPDLCHHRLCGSTCSEYTNASTTQLVNARARRWDDELFARLDLPRALMPEIVEAGTTLGGLRVESGDEPGMGALRVVAPATHDTASAVAGTPLERGWAYVSSGTWSLVGVECDAPVMSDEAARANFTNEGGVAGTVRFLKNVMGLWLLERCRSEWSSAGLTMDVETLIDSVSRVGGFAGFVHPDAARFFNPPSMTAALRAALAETRQPAPDDPVVMTKVILDSLALRYASVVDTIESLTGRPVAGLHIVGGGSQNRYLNQATADATARPVLAGPVEAAAAGNLLVQAIASGEVASLADGRRLLSRLHPPERFVARNAAAWAEARKRFLDIESAVRSREGTG